MFKKTLIILIIIILIYLIYNKYKYEYFHSVYKKKSSNSKSKSNDTTGVIDIKKIKNDKLIKFFKNKKIDNNKTLTKCIDVNAKNKKDVIKKYFYDSCDKCSKLKKKELDENCINCLSCIYGQDITKDDIKYIYDTKNNKVCKNWKECIVNDNLDMLTLLNESRSLTYKCSDLFSDKYGCPCIDQYNLFDIDYKSNNNNKYKCMKLDDIKDKIKDTNKDKDNDDDIDDDNDGDNDDDNDDDND